MAGGGMIAVEAGKKGYPGKFTIRVFITCIVAATGGLIFGYDIGISGGVTSMPQFLEKFFPEVYRKEELNIGGTNQYCKFASQTLTLFTSSLYIAALVASLVASTVTRVFGRRISMLAGGLLFLAGALVNGFAKTRIYLYIGRALLGVGVGFANQSVPVYLSEMAPYRHRGWLNMVFQLSITIGILVAYLINYFTAQMKNGQGWRWSLGCAGVPAILFLVGSAVLPDTPNSLIERGKTEEAKERLRKIRGIENVDEEFDDLINASNESKKIRHPWLKIMSRKYRPQLVFVTFIPFFQQLTGMNVFMFYAPVLFKTIGFGSKASLMSSVITGGVNTVSTFVSMLTVDKFGRRVLFLEGGIQMFICQIIITVCIAIKFGLSGQPSELEHWYALLVVIAICVYVAGFAWSWGPLGWLVPSEILPLEVRSAGQSINVAVNMIFTFFIAQVYLTMMCYMKFGLFIFFAFFVFSMTIFIYKLFPETKGIPIEEMSEIWKSHPCWKHYVVDDNETTVAALEMTEEVKVVAKQI